MPTPKDFLKAQASVLSQLPDPISPQVANSLIQVANALPDVSAPTLPGGQALQLPVIGAIGLPQLPVLGPLPGIQAGGAITGPIEFIQSVEASLPAGAPKIAASLAGGFRSIESAPTPQTRPSGGVQGGGYRSI